MLLQRYWVTNICMRKDERAACTISSHKQSLPTAQLTSQRHTIVCAVQSQSTCSAPTRPTHSQDSRTSINHLKATMRGCLQTHTVSKPGVATLTPPLLGHSLTLFCTCCSALMEPMPFPLDMLPCMHMLLAGAAQPAYRTHLQLWCLTAEAAAPAAGGHSPHSSSSNTINGALGPYAEQVS